MWVLQIFHDCFDRSQSFAYQWKFKINLSNSPQNNSVEILISVTLKLQPNFEGIDTSALILKIQHDIDSAIYLVFGFSQQYFAVISLSIAPLLLTLFPTTCWSCWKMEFPPPLISFFNYMLSVLFKYCISLLLLYKKITTILVI